MSFDSDSGECKTQVAFSFPDHPEIPVNDCLKQMMIEQIHILCGAMDAARMELFSANGQDQRTGRADLR